LNEPGQRVILSVDTGIDDALALAFAVRHPGIQLEAVLTVAGNVGLELVTNNTLRVLDWLGATDVPVIAGADRPLAGERCDAVYFHGPDGLGGARLPASTRAALDDAPGYLIERVLAEPGELTVVCTGPLTDLALAVQRAPPVAEFNIYADPEAAAIVCAAAWQLVMVGLDVTSKVVLTADEARMIDGASSREATLIREVTRYPFEQMGLDGLALHDPLAVGVALEPSLVKTRSGAVLVETRGEYTRGQTVFDLRRRAPAGPSNTRVCVDVEAERFRQQFFDTLGIFTRS
jgi:purine nucleosidase